MFDYHFPFYLQPILSMNMDTDEVFSYRYFVCTLAGKLSKTVTLPELTNETDFDKFAVTAAKALVEER